MNGVTALRHIDSAFALWRRRSATTWKLDLSILTDVGVTIKRPPRAAERPGVASATLAAEHSVPGSAPIREDAGEIVARIAIERGIALPTSSAESPRSSPPPPARTAVTPGPHEESPSLLRRLSAWSLTPSR
ncbi:hypothetical protein [Streptomyces sp. LN499]|uniref:hypothetical protein n=1 Tax=Streptomyces sp. LN499 TaxID=3112977 RepID=UPI0037223847